MIISESQLKILNALGTYKYLTVSQIDKLKIFQHKVSIYRAIKPLKSSKRALINFQSFPILPMHGKLEELLFLSNYGKEVLAEHLDIDESNIKIPSSKALVSSDYFHRVSTIEFHLQLDIYLKNLPLDTMNYIDFFNYYFDKTRKRGSRYAKALNRIDIASDKYIIPDAITKFTINGTKYLYLFEQHNTKTHNQKIMTQILNHCLVIKDALAAKKYNFERNNRVVVVFEYESSKTAIIKKAKENPNLLKYKNFFLLKTNEELSDFFSGWQNLYGETLDFI